MRRSLRSLKDEEIPAGRRGSYGTRLATESSSSFSRFHIGVLMGVRRGAAAEEPQRFFCGDGVPRARGDENGVAGADGARFAIDFDFAIACEDEIKFLGEFMIVALRRAATRHPRFGQALLFDGRIGAIEDAADGGAVFRGEWRLGFEV